MKYKVNLGKKVYEVEVEEGKAMLLDEYEAKAPVPPAAPIVTAASQTPETVHSAIPLPMTPGTQVKSPLPGTVLKVNVAVGDAVKQAGIKIGEAYVAKKLIPKISKDFSKKLTQAVGRRVLTKGGSKGIINLGKLVPVIGGIVGGAYNYAEINIVARKAKNFFN